MVRPRVRTGRKSIGSAITETGPALLLYFCMVFFPLLDILYMCCGYGFGWFLHNTVIREVSVRQPSQAATAITKADLDFFTNARGFGKFLQIAPADVTHSNYRLTAGVNGRQGEVSLTTTIRIRPWLMIPFPPNVPGLSARINLSFSSAKPQEETGRDG